MTKSWIFIFINLFWISKIQAQESIPIPNALTLEFHEPVLSAMEIPASFPGGQLPLDNFLHKHLIYPENAKTNNIKGRIFLKFIVTKTGKIVDPKILNSLGFGCDEEALRILSLMPNWLPGYQNDKAVNAFVTIPFFFPMY